ETERDELSDEEEELEEKENAETILLGFLSLCEQCYLAPRIYDVAKSYEWREKILPAYDEERFKKLFRLSRHSFTLVVAHIKNNNVFISEGNKQQAPVELQLAVFLRRLGTMEDIFSIGSQFGIAEGTVILYSKQVMKALCHLQAKFVKWPSNAPKKDPETFFNHKKQYSIQYQAIVDANGIFTDFYIGWPGSVHDAK
ncbi:4276_t:CDS:2, partial [Paraglomus occultum]